jgi:indolepyruvate ferredoxin oxidoreductase alpha subunit
MPKLSDNSAGEERLLMGNEAIARGALEAGLQVAAGYPGTPSSEIVDSLSKIAGDIPLYVEWSANEKVSMEVAAAASFAGLRSLCAMKQNGINVASDFLLHLAGSGIRGGMVIVSCDDPGALSSVNEGESRHFARLVEIPLLEPGDFQEAKDMTRWAFELSERLGTPVMLRSVTRMSHASGIVRLGPLPGNPRRAAFRCEGFMLDPDEGPMVSAPVGYRHETQQGRIRRARDLFEASPFNTYEGPEKPELLAVTCSASALYCREAVSMLGAAGRVGLLKIGTTWPLPAALVKSRLAAAGKVLFVEEILPFLEENVKVIAAESAGQIGVKTFYGKNEGTLPMNGELNPDRVAGAMAGILGIACGDPAADYRRKAEAAAEAMAPQRGQTFCPGCPHRASFWLLQEALRLDNRKGFICGDIGCYSLALLPCGFNSLKTLHSMGSGMGIASGFGKLGAFGMDQPVVTVCGDSTFYHAVLPALINAVHHRANVLMAILDNSGTAMTGFQPHPGSAVNAVGEPSPRVDIEAVCRSLGVGVEVRDPFDLAETRRAVNGLLEQEGVRVLVLRQSCALSPEKRARKAFQVRVDEKICLGEACGCGRFCTRVFRCPGLLWDKAAGKARIDEVICAGCGVCSFICPQGAIAKEVV